MLNHELFTLFYMKYIFIVTYFGNRFIAVTCNETLIHHNEAHPYNNNDTTAYMPPNIGQVSSPTFSKHDWSGRKSGK